MPLSSGEDTPPDCLDEPDCGTDLLTPPAVALPGALPAASSAAGLVGPGAIRTQPRLPEILLRPGLPADTESVNRMLARSYRALLAEDYPPELLREALPFLKRPRPGLLTCGTYFLALDASDERVLAAGGWTDTTPWGAPGRPGEGHVRHVATDPDAARQGLGARVMRKVIRSARAAGVELLHCQSTLTAVPFYMSLGFEPRAEIELRLPNGILFPAVQMRWTA